MSVRSATTTDLVVDVVGYFTSSVDGQGFDAIRATRVVNTYTGLGAPKATVAQGKSLTVDLSAVLPPEATTAAINVTAMQNVGTTNVGHSGWYTVSAPGRTDSVNADFGPQPTSNMLFAPVANRQLEINVGSAPTPLHITVEVQGFFYKDAADQGGFVPKTGKVIDTRIAPAVAIPAGGVSTFNLAGRVGIPTSGVSALLGTVTVVGPGQSGYLRVWGAQEAEPATATMNFTKGKTEGNTAVVGLSAISSPTIKIRNSAAAAVDVIFDVQGWFTASPPPAPSVASSLYVSGGSVEYADDPLTDNFSWKPASAQVVSYEYAKDNGTPTATTSRSLRWYPKAGQHKLTVWAINRSGLRSNPTTMSFAVSDPSIPNVPFGTKTASTDTSTPVLSAVSTSPSGGQVETRFFVAKVDGTVVGESPYASTALDSGSRASAQLADGDLVAGQQYQWWAQSCSSKGCSATTSKQGLTAAAVTTETPETQTQILPASAIRTYVLDTVGCSGSSCFPVASSPKIGRSAGHDFRTLVAVDTSAIPAGSVVTKASLGLGSSNQSSSVDVRVPTGAWSAQTPIAGVDVVTREAGVVASQSVTANAPAVFDVGPIVAGWMATPAQNNGLELRASADSPGVAQFVGAVSVTVEFVSPRSPSRTKNVVATAAAGGAVVSWTEPDDSGYAGAVTSYQVQARGANGHIVEHTVADGLSGDLIGLADGVGYTITVVAITPHGRTDSEPVHVTPTASSTTATSLATAAHQFVTARNSLEYGQASTPAAALAGKSESGRISTILTAHAPGIIAQRNVVARHTGGAEIGLTVTQTTDATLVVSTATGADLRVLRTTTIPPDEQGAEPIVSDFTETYRFERVGETFVLRDIFGSSAADSTPTTTSGATAMPINDSGDSAALQSENQDRQPALLDAEGWPLADTSGTVQTQAVVGAGRRLKMAQFAYRLGRHDGRRFGCAPFISLALKYGGGVQERRPPSWQWWLRRKDTRYWYDFGSGHTSWSWTDSLSQYFFLKNIKASTFTDWRWANPGDIVYYDQHTRDDPRWHLHHTSMVFAKSRGLIYVVQQNSPQPVTTLQAQWFKYHRPGANGIAMYFAGITQT